MSEEIRTTSATGGQKGVKAERYDLLPTPALDAIARVYAFGAQKYADHNWRRGYEWSKSYQAMMRHLTAFWDGETHDQESGLPHLGHAGFHLMALLTWLEEDGEGVGNPYDDRWSTTREREEREEQSELAESLATRWVRDYDREQHRPFIPVFPEGTTYPSQASVREALERLGPDLLRKRPFRTT